MLTFGLMHGHPWRQSDDCVDVSERASIPPGVMRVFGWLLIVAGVLLAVTAFFITANAPRLNPWPALVGGFCLTGVGIIVLMHRRPK
jgi:hypothetical protein